MSLLQIISSTYFTWLYDRNALFFIGKVLSYVIGFLPIICKTLNPFCFGTGYNTNSNQASLHCLLIDGYWLFTKSFSSLGQFSSVHHKVPCLFATNISFTSLTVSIFYGAENSASDYMGINYQYQTTNFARDISLL